ncbi:MAG: hypothetical protein ACE5FY_03955 [Nitrospiria bacterium]
MIFLVLPQPVIADSTQADAGKNALESSGGNIQKKDESLMDTAKDAVVNAADAAVDAVSGAVDAATDATADAADKTHSFLSRHIVSNSDKLDAFFGDERMDVETNRTKVRLNLVSLVDDEGKYQFKPNVAVSLILPRTKKRFKLVVEDVQDTLSDNDESGIQGEDRLVESVFDTTLSTALRYIFIDTKKFNIQFDLGVKARTPIDPFTRLRIRRSYFLKKWESRFIYSLKWPFSKKWEAVTSVAFDRPISEQFLFRFNNVAAWQRIESEVSFSHDFSLFHKLPDHKALVYFTGMKWVDEPSLHATSYQLGVTYRQRLFRHWCFFQIQPLVTYPKDKNFEFTPTVTFKIEFIFGGVG